MEPVKPETYSLDVVGGNGTPFRFTYWPSKDEVGYQDRRYPSQPTEPQYRPFFYDEHGQGCGPVLLSDTFTDSGGFGIRGWHEVDAWDVDRHTVALVGTWIKLIKERDVR